MKIIKTIALVFMPAVLSVSGCEQPRRTPAESLPVPSCELCAYAPAKINIIPLTEFAAAADFENSAARLTACIDVLDKFGCRVKTPGVFRFELYEYVPRSGQPKGKRLYFWPDIDLTDAETNNTYWRDFLRVYRFDLDLPLQLEKGCSYVLQATCLYPAGKRLKATIVIEYK